MTAIFHPNLGFRKWAMANKETFKIKPISELIQRYRALIESDWIDPFPYPYKQDALEYLSTFETASVSGVLFDPPYSMRQLKECYDNLGQSLTDTTCAVYSRWKDAIARIIKPGGMCISFAWNSNGLGKGRGFEIQEIMLVPHGGCHNDTIVTVERRVNGAFP